VDTAALQRRVAEFTATHNLDIPAEVRLLDLVSELGELAKEPLRATDYGRRPFVPTTAWHDEFGDVLFSLVCLANATGVDIAAALDGALAKYAARLAERGSPGSAR